MKKSEVYIKKLAKEFNISEATATEVYTIINEYDWAVFISYMADYDHPEERVKAKQVLDSKKSNYSEEFQKTFDKIQTFMKDDWREYNIHEMLKEVE